MTSNNNIVPNTSLSPKNKNKKQLSAQRSNIL